MSDKKEFSPRAWFFTLFGFEESVESVRKNLQIVEKPDHFEMTSKINNITYNAGKFLVRSISSFTNLEPRGGGKLHLIHGHGGYNKIPPIIDILSMQSIPEWNGATYLAASNFNCLEFTGPSQNPSMGVTRYYSDHTQGPYCALATGPATVLRNYRYPAVNLLENTPIPVQNGYAMITKSDSDRLFSKGTQWCDPKNFRVGVHRNCQVTTTRSEMGFKRAPKNVIAHHVYAAALNFGGTCVRNEATLKISETLLSAEYKCAILAAWENSVLFPNLPGSKKLSLTFLGGGVFRNPKNLICRSIGKNEDVIIESGLDVYLVCFNDVDFGVAQQELGEIVKKTGGSVIEVDKKK